MKMLIFLVMAIIHQNILGAGATFVILATQEAEIRSIVV
jgi:hypothetical protein